MAMDWLHVVLQMVDGVVVGHHHAGAQLEAAEVLAASHRAVGAARVDERAALVAAEGLHD